MKKPTLKTQQRGNMVRAILVLPDGTQFVRSQEATVAALSGLELGGAFGRKLKKGLKAAVVKPAKLAHKITHGKNSPIRKAELAVQKFVSKNLPIAKPFINIHNSLAKPVHKALAGKKVKAKVTAQGIARVTANLPPAQKKVAQQALALQFKKREAVQDLAKAVAKKKVVAAAAKAIRGGTPKQAATGRRVLRAFAAAKPTGTFVVKTPSGKTIKVPASKVA